MNKYRLAALLLSGICLVSARAWADAPPANVPDIQVGDMWKYRSLDGFTNEITLEYSQRVVDVNDKEITIQLKNKNSPARNQRFYTREWNALDLGDMTYKPYFPEYKFPMAVGQEWKEEFKSVSTSGKFFTSFVKIKVVAFEKITVPAGTFDAYKIERTTEAHSVDANSDSATGKTTTWYAPAAKKYVRRDASTFSDGRLRAKSVDELIEYSPQEKATPKN